MFRAERAKRSKRPSSPPFRRGRAAFGRGGKKPAAKTRRGARFGTLVVGVMVICFLSALYWPQSGFPVAEFLPAAQPDRPSFTCDVVRVNDGDTLRCADGVRVRLHAVAARETDETCSPGHPCPEASAIAAREALMRLAANRTITCTPIGTSYDRVTAICRNDGGVEINCAMIESGTTVVWERFNREAPICQS